jgi:tol-pal system protein YbgF
MNKRQLILSALLISACTLTYAEVPVYDASEYESARPNTATTPTIQSRAQQYFSPRLSMQQRVSKLEQQVANQMDLPQQLSDLQQQVQELNGKLDVAMQTIKQLREQQKSMYQDLDNRVANKAQVDQPPANQLPVNQPVATNNPAVQTAATPVVANNVVTSTPAAPTSSSFLSEQDAYLAGYNQIKNRDYAKAKIALQNYLQKYPQGQYAVNAHYWLGELYLISNDTTKSITEFKTIIQKYPNDPKVANAKLKLGFIYFDSGELTKAKTQLLAVKKEYPGTKVAELAADRLSMIP